MAGLCNIDEAIHLLQSGQVVGLPTETVYGLGANALDTTAVAKVYEAKNRPSFDPLIVHVADLDGVRNIAELIPDAESLLLAFSPGPITVVLNKKPNVPDLVTSGHPTVAVRIPAHPMMLQVLKQSGLYIACKSYLPHLVQSPCCARGRFTFCSNPSDLLNTTAHNSAARFSATWRAYRRSARWGTL